MLRINVIAVNEWMNLPEVDERVRVVLSLLGKGFVCALCAAVILQAGEIRSDPPVLVFLVLLGVATEFIYSNVDSTLLKFGYVVILGAILGILVSRETVFELLFALFFGGLLLIAGQHILNRTMKSRGRNFTGLS